MEDNLLFSGARFPVEISYGSTGGPQYSTTVSAVGGNINEQRNINWSQARCVYNVFHGVKTQEQLDELISFFRAHKGRAIGFRYKDWCDYSVQNQVICSNTKDTDNTFQLIKSYRVGDMIENRIIYTPVQNTVRITINGKQTNDYAINYNKGKIRFNHNLDNGSIIEASFEFDVPVRFDLDVLEAKIDNFNTYSCDGIILKEIKPY